MTTSVFSHPCEGLSCENCVSCKFDEPLFDELEQKEEKEMETCNLCGYLIKAFVGCDKLTFNATCGLNMSCSPSYLKPTTIAYGLNRYDEVKRPSWCPKVCERKNKEENVVKPIPISPIDEDPQPKKVEFKDMSYTEKREVLKKMPTHLKWDDITVGETYFMPRILSSSYKKVMVESKTEFMIRVKEVLNDGSLASYSTSIYPNDVESVFITTIKEF